MMPVRCRVANISSSKSILGFSACTRSNVLPDQKTVSRGTMNCGKAAPTMPPNTTIEKKMGSNDPKFGYQPVVQNNTNKCDYSTDQRPHDIPSERIKPALSTQTRARSRPKFFPHPFPPSGLDAVWSLQKNAILFWLDGKDRELGSCAWLEINQRNLIQNCWWSTRTKAFEMVLSRQEQSAAIGFVRHVRKGMSNDG